MGFQISKLSPIVQSSITLPGLEKGNWVVFQAFHNSANAELFHFIICTWLGQVRREGEGGVGGHHKDQGDRQRGEAEGERNHSLGGISVAAVKPSISKMEGFISVFVIR